MPRGAVTTSAVCAPAAHALPHASVAEIAGGVSSIGGLVAVADPRAACRTQLDPCGTCGYTTPSTRLPATGVFTSTACEPGCEMPSTMDTSDTVWAAPPSTVTWTAIVPT